MSQSTGVKIVRRRIWLAVSFLLGGLALTNMFLLKNLYEVQDEQSKERAQKFFQSIGMESWFNAQVCNVQPRQIMGPRYHEPCPGCGMG